MGDIEPWIVATQNSLGAVISAPKLTDKLLRKPPFRFLHDVVTNFIKAASFPVGLYSDDMLDSSKCSEKEQKLDFLVQLVNVVQVATGKTTTARPPKIIAGAEPEGTNDLLQLLASCAGLSAKEKEAAVKKALGGGAEPAPQAAPAAAPAAPPAAAPAPAPAPAAAPKPTEKPAPAAADAPEAPPAKQRRSKHEAPPAVVETRPAPREEEPPARLANRGGAAEVPQPTPLTAAAAQGDRPGTASARKAPPRSVSNEIVENRAEPVQPVAGVIVESRRGTKGGDDDDEGTKEKDWMKLVEEHESAGRSGGNAAAANAEEAKGYLGQQALKAKREQEEAARKAAEEARAADGTTGIVLNVHKRDKAGSAMGDGELSKLREQLQMLTKASNPLGKFLEAIQEDIDTMSRELEMWRSEARTQAAAARDAQRDTENSLHEVHVQQQALEDAISDQITKTNMIQSKILENEKTIETMVRMVVNPDSAKPTGGAATAKR